MSNNNNDGFVDGIICAVVFGCAAYGAYKIYENVTKSPEQRLLENLGRDLKQLDTGMNYGTPVEVDYEESE